MKHSNAFFLAALFLMMLGVLIVGVSYGLRIGVKIGIER